MSLEERIRPDVRVLECEPSNLSLPDTAIRVNTNREIYEIFNEIDREVAQKKEVRYLKSEEIDHSLIY